MCLHEVVSEDREREDDPRTEMGQQGDHFGTGGRWKQADAGEFHQTHL